MEPKFISEEIKKESNSALSQFIQSVAEKFGLDVTIVSPVGYNGTPSVDTLDRTWVYGLVRIKNWYHWRDVYANEFFPAATHDVAKRMTMYAAEVNPPTIG